MNTKTPSIQPVGAILTLMASYREQIQQAIGESRDVNIDQVVFLEALIDAGKVKPREIKSWVQEARRRGLQYPQLALSKQLVTSPELADMLAEQMGMPRFDEQQVVDLGQARSVPDADIHALHAIPVGNDAETDQILVVTDRVNNHLARNRMPAVLSARPEDLLFVLASPEEFSALRQRVAAREDAPDTVATQMDIRAGETQEDLAARRFVESMIQTGQQRGASDIHFQPGADYMVVRMRLNRDLLSVERVPKALQKTIISVAKNMAKMDQAETYKSQDGHIVRDFGAGPIDVRAATMRTRHGEEIELRLLDPRTRRMGLGELGIAQDRLELVTQVLSEPEGLIIVSGATGMGKTTTLYAMLEHVDDPARKIITIESPVELELANASQIEVNPKRGITFAGTVENILRNDPDIIMVGEVRRREEAEAAIAAAETGHLVLTSLHARSAVGVINRLIQRGVDKELISYALALVTHQRLVRRVCRYCAIEVPYSKTELKTMGMPAKMVDAASEKRGKVALSSANPVGCDHCIKGYDGLLGIHEVLVIDSELRGMIDQGETALKIQHVVDAREDHVTLRDDFFAKVLDGRTTLEERKRLLSLG
jgi:type IV pilus assembly protein PilB